MTRPVVEVKRTYPGAPVAIIEGSVAALAPFDALRMSQGASLSQMRSLSPFGRLMAQVGSDVPVALSQITDVLKGEHMPEIHTWADFAQVAEENFDIILKAQTAGSRQVGLSPETYRDLGWIKLQRIVARLMNDPRDLHTALLIMEGIILDRITQVRDEKSQLPIGLPKGGLNEGEAEYCVTESLNLLTNGPLAQKLHERISTQGAKQSAASEPVWVAVTQMYAEADPGILGNYLATNARGSTPAKRAILEVANGMRRAARTLELNGAGTEAEQNKAIGSGVPGATAAMEYTAEDMSEKPDPEATKVLRTLLVQDRHVHSVDTVVAMVEVAKRDRRMVDSGMDKEQTYKLIRSEQHRKAVANTTGEQGEAGVAIRKKVRLPMRGDIGPLPLMGDGQAQLRRATAKALCGDLADYTPEEVAGKKHISYQRMNMPQVLFQFARKAGIDGMPLLEVGASKEQPMRELKPGEKLLSEALEAEIGTLDAFISSCSGSLAELKDGTDLNRNERAAVLLVERTLKLVQRSSENDVVKYHARDAMMPLLAKLIKTADTLDPVLQQAFEYSLQVIGAAWPASSMARLMEGYVKLEARHPGIHMSLLDIGKALGAYDPADRLDAQQPLTDEARSENISLGARPGHTNDTATRLFVACQQKIITEWMKIHAGDASHRSLLRELSRQVIAFEVYRKVQELVPIPSVQTAYEVAAMMAYLFPRDNMVQITVGPIIDSTLGQIDAKSRLRVVKMGDIALLRQPASDSPKAQQTARPVDIERLQALVDRVLGSSTEPFGLLDASLKVVNQLATDDERAQFGVALGKALSAEIAPILTGHEDSPLLLGRMLNTTQARINEMQERVRAAVKQLTNKDAMAAFLGTDLRKDLLAIGMQDLSDFDTARAKVAREENEILIKVGEARTSLVDAVDSMHGNRKRKEMEMVTALLNVAKECIPNGFGGMDMATIASLASSIISGNGNSGDAQDGSVDGANTLTTLLTVLGGLGTGYTVARGQQAAAAPATSVVGATADAAAREQTTFSTEEARMRKAIGTFFEHQALQLQAVYDAKLRYYAELGRNINASSSTSLYEALQTLTAQTKRQYGQLRQALPVAQNALGTMITLKAELAKLQAEEGQDIVTWVRQLKTELFPTIFGMMRSIKFRYNLSFDIIFPDVEALIGSAVSYADDNVVSQEATKE